MPPGSKPLVHAKREGADSFARDVAESDEVEHFVHAAAVDAVAVGQPLEVVGGAAATDDRSCVQQRANRSERIGQLVIRLAVDQDRARTRSVKAQDHAHRGRLAGPVWAHKAGHPAGLHVEGDSVDGNRGAVALGEMLRLDHLLFLSRCA